MAALRRYLIAGAIAMTPVVVVIMLVSWFVGLSDRAIALLPKHLQPDVLLGLHIPGLGILLTLLLVLMVGILTTNFIGSHFMGWIDMLMDRIPLVRSVHHAVKQLMEALLSGSGKAFQRVVLVPFPKEDSWTIGFVTGEAAWPGDKEGEVEELASVFVPTTPIPTSGWLLYVPASRLKTLDISVEEGMRIVLSGGMIGPKRREGP